MSSGQCGPARALRPPPKKFTKLEVTLSTILSYFNNTDTFFATAPPPILQHSLFVTLRPSSIPQSITAHASLLHSTQMERKRVAVTDPELGPPPSKHFRPTSHADTQASASTRATASFQITEPDPLQPEEQKLINFQRAQLAAKISEQSRDNARLHEKVEELRKLVAVLDAAPRAALYHMCAVREDLTLTLARMGVTNDPDPGDSPIAAVMLNAEEVTNRSLGEIPAAIKKLTAQIVLAIEAKHGNSEIDAQVRKANDDLHRRLRQVSDQLERYAEREKQSLVSSTTFRDEYDDLRAELSLQRRRMVALELQLKEKEDALTKQKEENMRMGEDVTNASKTEDNKEHGDPSTNSISVQNGDIQAIEAAKELSERRLEELNKLHETHKQTLSELERTRTDVEKRDTNIVPINAVLASGLYQTMEANLQQLYLQERSWQMEKDALKKELEAQRKEAREELATEKAASEKAVEDLHKHMDELRRVADAAKVEKDKVVMTYEVRKMEANNAASVIEAATKRAEKSELMRETLSKANSDLTREVEKLRERVKEMEGQLKQRGSVDLQSLVDDLRKDFDDERAKSAAFIEEVENLSNMFGEVEGENEKLVKALSEKEQVLSKVMAERLRGRQLLTTVKEENRVLCQGRELDGDKIKALTAALAASKKSTQEATSASLKGQQEARELCNMLDKRRRIADEMSLASRSAVIEKEDMKKERDFYINKVERIASETADDKFSVNRLKETVAEMEQRAKEAEEALQNRDEKGGTNEAVKDALILELRKKLNCSIVTGEPKQVVLLRCGHLFSRQCTDNLIATRNRKCPMCGKAFGNDDVRPVFF